MQYTYTKGKVDIHVEEKNVHKIVKKSKGFEEVMSQKLFNTESFKLLNKNSKGVDLQIKYINNEEKVIVVTVANVAYYFQGIMHTFKDKSVHEI